MKAVLISIRPKWCAKIASGRKTIEIRKTCPRQATPFKCYIYCTNEKKTRFWTGPRYSYADDHSHNQFDRCGNGFIIGEFVCDAIHEIKNVGCAFKVGKTEAETNNVAYASCLDFGDMRDYLGHRGGYGWHISALKMYDKPKKLSEFEKACNHKNDCCTCKRFSVNYACINSISRPPQSYMYVEEMTT